MSEQHYTAPPRKWPYAWRHTCGAHGTSETADEMTAGQFELLLFRWNRLGGGQWHYDPLPLKH